MTVWYNLSGDTKIKSMQPCGGEARDQKLGKRVLLINARHLSDTNILRDNTDSLHLTASEQYWFNLGIQNWNDFMSVVPIDVC